jgi:hypothetical protein
VDRTRKAAKIVKKIMISSRPLLIREVGNCCGGAKMWKSQSATGITIKKPLMMSNDLSCLT